MLAIFTSQLGASFINRHVEDLLPGKTVAVSRYSEHPRSECRYEPNCPTLYLDRWALGISVRLARRAGVETRHLRQSVVQRFLKRHNVDIVLGEFLDQFLEFVPLFSRARIPYVVQAHGIDVSAALREPGMGERYLAYKSAKAILTRCDLHRRRLVELGLPPEIVHVNHGGVDIPETQPRRPSAASKRFLAIGVMVPKKGPLYLLEAFRRAAEQDPDITLDFAGGGQLLPAARQFVDACNLVNRVNLHGFVSEEEKFRLLRNCGVFLQHSLTDPDTGNEEGLPAAIQEAMAHGMAVVSTKHAGIPEAVIDGETGLLVDETNVSQMATAILRVPQNAARMGAQGYRLAKNEHSWQDEKTRLLHWLKSAA